MAVACGGEFSAALGVSGAMFTWGEGAEGQLGHGGSGGDGNEDAYDDDEDADDSIALEPRRLRAEGLMATVTVTVGWCSSNE